MDKKAMIILGIVLLTILAAGIGAAVFFAPDTPDDSQVVADIHKDNTVIKDLGIVRPNTKVERLLALRTYQHQLNMDEMITDLINIGKNGQMEYWEADPNGDDFLLIAPFETNGKMQISTLKFDQYEEIYEPKEIIFKANNGKELPDNYSLLIKYSRPPQPEYEIRLSQKNGEQTATYQIRDTETIDGFNYAVGTTQFVKEDSAHGTESVGKQIQIFREKQQ